MARPVKSQWDFGELFPVAATRRVVTVAQLTADVKRLLEDRIGQVWVSGEITNLRVQSSGHLYFTLKDAAAQLSCVLFRGEAGVRRDWVQDGRQVVVQGEVTVYEPRGQYQLRVVQVELGGMGALQLAFEQLKQKLHAEGLFAPERKRPLPRYPARIGLVTSPTGAALRDVLHVVARRHAALELVLAPCRVQGEGAAAEIAAAIAQLNAWHAGAVTDPGRRLDAILVTRGGGSLEDLWAFNEETVARAIAGSALPVVSAVGHEVDFTIGDFVADLRAATPSAAAELLTEGVHAAREFVAEAPRALGDLARAAWAAAAETRAQWVARLQRTHPRRRLQERWQRLDDLRAGLQFAARARGRALGERWRGVRARWLAQRPGDRLPPARQALVQAGARLVAAVRRQAELRDHRVETLGERLRLLNPTAVLARGYSITQDAATGQVLRSAVTTRAGQRLRTRLHDGEVDSTVS